MNRYIKFLTVIILIFYPLNVNSHPEDFKTYKNIKMNVFKDGKKIGFSKYTFSYIDGKLEVNNHTEFEVKLLGIKLFSIISKGTENYVGNQLVSFKSNTLQNDKKKYVNLELLENKQEFKIEGSSYKGKSEIQTIVGNWWNHDILEMNSQISPLSGSVKEQIVKYLGEETIKIKDIKYRTKHFSLKSKDPNTPENKLGLWEYKIENYEKK